MGANLCTPGRPTKPKSSAATDIGNSSSGSKFMNFIKPKCLNVTKKTHNLKTKTQFEATDHQKKAIITNTFGKLTLEDWLSTSPVSKPDNLNRREFSPFRQRKRRVHPSGKVRACSSISEANDSLCLERPINQHEDCEAKSESLISPIRRSSSGKSQRRVSFKLPHVVILYDEPDCGEALCYSPENPCSSEESFYSPVNDTDWKEDSFESSEDIGCKLAVHNLPRLTVASCP